MKDLLDNSIFSKRISLPNLMKRIDRLCERANKRTNRLVAKAESEGLKSEAKIESEQLTSVNNCRNLPSNATIRKEYVRCGKSDCSRCKHGPYYYAYWKKNGRLHKRYIGKYATRTDRTGEYKSIRNRFYGSPPSRDINVDPSNSPKGYITKTKNVRARRNKLRQDQI